MLFNLAFTLLLSVILLISFALWLIVHFYTIFVVAVGVALIWLIFKRFPRHVIKDRSYLTVKIDEEIARLCPEGKWSYLKSWYDQIYIPSWRSLVFVGVVLVPFIVVSHIETLNLKINVLNFFDSTHFQNLIAIHAGVGAIIFALLIFVAESLRDENNKDRARVLLKESMLFPLTVAEIAVFLNFIWGKVTIFSVVPIFIVAVATIYALWKLFAVLLSKAEFAKKRQQLLKDRIQHSIDLALHERFGNNILLESLGENKIELTYYPGSLKDREPDYHYFYAPKTGFVNDIKLDKLAVFAKLVEKEANKNGFSFYKEKAKQISLELADESQATEDKLRKYTHTDSQYLVVKYKDEIEEDDKSVICIEKRILKDDTTLNDLRQLVKEIFVIGKGDNFSEEVNLELDDLKDQFITSIVDKRLGRIDELSKIYIDLAKSFLEFLNRCGGGYTFEQATKERHAIFGGWNEIRWLEESIREIYIKATESHDQEVIRRVTYIPVAIAIQAIKFGDQYLYQEFLRFPPHLYWLALKEPNKDIKDFMIERSWRHLKEMSTYYIESELKRRVNDERSINKYKEFTIPVFLAFQSLIKSAFDKRDFNSFQDFIDQLRSLYNRLDPEDEYPNSEHLEATLKWANSDSEKLAIQEKIAFLTAKEKALQEINNRKHQVIFGITAWILEKYRQNKTDETLNRFFGTARNYLPSDLEKLTNIYSSARTFETEDLWGWDNWEMIPDGVVRSVDFHSKLDRLFVVQALSLLRGKSEEQINQISLPVSRELAYQVDEQSGSLIKILKEISDNPGEWEFVMNAGAVQQIESLKILFQKAKTAQDQNEQEFLKTAEIDSEKHQEFIAKLKGAFEENTHLRKLAKKLGIYNDLTNEQPGTKLPSYGYNNLAEKAAFVKDWHVHYIGWGEQYGEGMARSEDQIAFEKLTSGITETVSVKKVDTISGIQSAIAKLNFKNPIILQTLTHIYEYEELKKSEGFIPEYREDCPRTGFESVTGYMGVLKFDKHIVPIIDVFVGKDSLRNKVVILEPSTIGVWNQYSPLDKPEDLEFQNGIFYLRVADLNQATDLRQKILEEDPQWLQEHDDKEGYLRQKVLVNLYQKFEFRIDNPNSGIVLSITEN